jgi:sulfide:quinone oxidoreductase
VAYDKLIVAVGAPREAAYANATTFRGEHDVQSVHGLVQDIEMGVIRRLAFVVPDGVSWSLPLYELALMTARRAFDMNVELELTFITPEDRPLSVFGARAAGDVEQLLEAAGVRLITGAVAEIPARGKIVLPAAGEQHEVDRIIALPVSRGPALRGLPSDGDGFIPINSFARVDGVDGVYAAGDGANFPLKQGGLACQQADAAAEHIAWTLGKLHDPRPFRPVLRGALLTGAKPQFMRHDLEAEQAADEASGTRPLWWPATKVAGKYLAAYLAEVDRSQSRTQELAPGIRRRAFLVPASDETLAVPLRGYEYTGRWGTATP